MLIAANDNDTMVPIWVVARQFMSSLKNHKEGPANG